MRTWIIHRRGINLFINLPILGKFPRNIVYTQSLSNSKPQSSHHIIGTKELSNLTRVIQGYISSSAYSYRLQAPQKNQPRRKTMRYTLTIRQKWLSQETRFMAASFWGAFSTSLSASRSVFSFGFRFGHYPFPFTWPAASSPSRAQVLSLRIRASASASFSKWRSQKIQTPGNDFDGVKRFGKHTTSLQKETGDITEWMKPPKHQVVLARYWAADALCSWCSWCLWCGSFRGRSRQWGCVHMTAYDLYPQCFVFLAFA